MAARSIAAPTAICQRVKERFGLVHLSDAAVRQAPTQLDDNPIRRAMRGQLERGTVHYREEWRLAELFTTLEQVVYRRAPPRPKESSGWGSCPAGRRCPRRRSNGLLSRVRAIGSRWRHLQR